jgi:hypothetical protein
MIGNIRKPSVWAVAWLIGVCLIPVVGYAEDAGSWLVAGLEGGAWKSSERDPSVRTAVHPGDVIRSNERIETFQNHQVTLAGDAAGRNLITAQGAVRLRQNATGTQLELERGRALAVLDDLKGRGDFSVATPIGVASVRGTRFAVTVPATADEMGVQTYRGEVMVRTGVRGVRGSRSRSAVVTKGKKLSVSQSGKGPLVTEDLMERDWSDYRSLYRVAQHARKSLRSNGARWFEDSRQPAATHWIPSIDPDRQSSDQEAKTIVF